jgi:hypothetical protein
MTPPLKTVRRVVTGEPQPGESEFTHVEEVTPLVPRPGFAQYHIWGFDETPSLPHHSTDEYVPRSHFPAPGGVRVFANLLSNLTEEWDSETAPAHKADDDEFVRIMSQQDVGTAVGTAPGMHRTDTIDIGVVVSGEVTVESTDGSKVTLVPGDVYIQNGAMHAWHGNPENPAHIVFVVVGASRDQEATP